MISAALDAPCRFCKVGKRTAIDSYKHSWLACESCGNIERVRKDRYLAERALPASAASWLASTDTRYIRTLRRFFHDPRVMNAPDSIFAYYQDAVANAGRNTKYERQFESISSQLGEYGISFADRSVLDVSGGPGLLVQRIGQVAKRAVMTEFDPAIVELARKQLGIETVHYDFNQHDIGQIVDGTFDLVLVRYAINFCNDVPTFLSSLAPRLNPGAHVFLSFVMPTMGTCLRWQFDDYAFNVLYNPETMTRMFTEAGFRHLGTTPEASYDPRTLADGIARALVPPYVLKNRFFSKVGAVLEQNDVAQVFQLA